MEFFKRDQWHWSQMHSQLHANSPADAWWSAHHASSPASSTVCSQHIFHPGLVSSYDFREVSRCYGGFIHFSNYLFNVPFMHGWWRLLLATYALMNMLVAIFCLIKKVFLNLSQKHRACARMLLNLRSTSPSCHLPSGKLKKDILLARFLRRTISAWLIATD